MPELPEVETLVRNLRTSLIETTILEARILDKKLPTPTISLPAKITNITRFAKSILFELKESNHSISYILIHLRMTGRLLHQTEGDLEKNLEAAEKFLENKIVRLKARPLTKYLRAEFSLTQGRLYFFDPRRFGTISWLTSKPKLTENQIDPLSYSFNSETILRVCKKSKSRNVKSLLLDQKCIVGIGNIYASEILFSSGIHPERQLGSLSQSEISSLVQATTSILKKAIEHQGTTFSDFQSGDSSIGSYQHQLKVYGLEGKACSKCQTEIQKITQQQRSTFYCENCQRASEVL